MEGDHVARNAGGLLRASPTSSGKETKISVLQTQENQNKNEISVFDALRTQLSSAGLQIYRNVSQQMDAILH